MKSKIVYIWIGIILLIILFLCIYVQRDREAYDNPSYCDFEGLYYSPSVIKTAGDTSNIGKFIRMMVDTALKTNLPKAKTLTFQLFNCPPSTVNNINVCGNYGANIGVGRISIVTIQNLFDSLTFSSLKQIQSFPIDDTISPGQGMKQTVYAVLPIGFDADVYVDVNFSGVPIPDFNNTLVKITGCASLFIKLAIECPSKSSTSVTSISLDSNSGIGKLNLNITNGDLSNLASIGSYITNMDITKLVKSGLNSAMSNTVYPRIVEAINSYLPYTLPIPTCVSVPGNSVTSSSGVKYTGLYGYRPTYPVPDTKNENWQKCTVSCAMAGIGKAQQCLDACIDVVDSSQVSNTTDCANKANLGYFQVNDRSAVKDGVAPNGPLWPKSCTVVAPSDPNLVPDIQSGYQWFQSIRGYIPAIEGLLPALEESAGVRGDLGDRLSHNDLMDCRYNCSLDPDCKSFSYAVLSDPSRGINSGDCFKVSGTNRTIDSNFYTYKVVPNTC